MHTKKTLTALGILAMLGACSGNKTPDQGAPPQPKTPAPEKATADTALPEAAKLEIVRGLLNHDLYIEMKARHNIITARILNDPKIKPKMGPLKKEYNALCAEYGVTLSDFNEYDSELLTWGSNYPEEFSALKKRVEKRRQELLESMPGK